MTQVKAIFKGRVQGVGFRYSTQILARRFRVSGFVRNLGDGTVELVAEGEKAEVQAFLRDIRGSHLGHHIEEILVDWANAANQFTRFEIRY